MPTKDDGKTYSCTHEEGKQNPSSICTECYGKNMTREEVIREKVFRFKLECNVTKLIDHEIARYQAQALRANIKDGGRVLCEHVFKQRLSDFFEQSLSDIWDKAVEVTLSALKNK